MKGRAMKLRDILLAGATVAAMTFSVGVQSAHAAAGFIALEGSDATSLHEDPVYTPELFKYLQGSSSLPVLVYNNAGTSTITAAPLTPKVYSGTLTGLTLSNYSAIYVQAPGTCCGSDPTALAGFGASVNAFVAAGGNLAIQNYSGGAFDGTVPGGAAPAGSIGGAAPPFGITYCSDGETINATGLAKGFTQPPIDGCWSHQGYENSYWLPLGYISLMNSATDLTDAATGGSGRGGLTYADGTQIGSSLLAFGGTLGAPVGVPEPGTLALFGMGLLGLGALRRRKVRA
jgi:hypothetical protein